MDAYINFVLGFSYILFAVAVIAIVVLPLVKSFDDPKSLAEVGSGILALVVLYFIAWLISGNEVTEVYAKHNVGPDLSKFVGGTLILVYILVFIAIVGIVYTEIAKIFK